MEELKKSTEEFWKTWPNTPNHFYLFIILSTKKYQL